MTINDINKILSRLAEQPTRENVLDFSFGLLQWMNIEPNAGNKPQLVSPQTQKLKDFLAAAPQTVQPQLYRISADNQNIRVRFAVLKKLKKEYISQLVDNDPGLSSYQSFTKGLTTQPGATKFIAAQPYFIHFVTTPEYDKLVLIFNQGEQKRIVTFRNRLTNTQHNKIINQWANIGIKSKPEIADLLWKSLDIKEVNKEFYKQIKERFDALINILSEPEFSGLNDNNIQNIKKQFAVRFLGRYIFCWFLKEKDGIIPTSLISSEEIKKINESGKSFYHERLLKLFFGTLNTLVSNRHWLKDEPPDTRKRFEKIPYLNGGLFDDNNREDQFFNSLQFNINDWLINFVEILESYDFTIDESSTQYQQVAVDPEMLGRIFENLLASQNEETEKMANQRKAFGAFYTPREIVDYMVNESIKAYLQTQWEQKIIEEKTKNQSNPAVSADLFGNKKPQQLKLETSKYELKAEEKQKIEKALETLFTANADAAHLKKDEKNLLDGFLKKIKVLDPACGSGAFPMGILHKLKELRERLGFYTDPYQLKLDILSNNIYGVDIMPMATEIARLRSWLSLILEADYKPNLPQNNFGVDALPNLDFKFVCANSLIDLGLDAFIQESKGTFHEGFTKKLVIQLKELEDLRKQFFIPALASLEKEKLKTEYLQKRNEVVTAIEAGSDPVLMEIAKKIKHWNPFDDSKASPFFSPTWMFGIDNGFDVVLGNPPYIGEKGHSAIFDKLKKIPKWSEFYRRRSNTYYFFIKLGLDFLRKGGIQSLIVPREFTSADWSNKVRKEIVEKSTLIEIIDFSNSKVFSDAGTSSLIIIHQKGAKLNYKFKLKVIPKESDIQSTLLDKSLSNDYKIERIKSDSFKPWSFAENDTMHSKKLCPLGSLFEISQGLVTGADKVTPQHIRKGLIDKKFGGRGIFILEEKVDIKFNGADCYLKINDEWSQIRLSDKYYIQPFYKPEHLKKWGTENTSFFTLYSGTKEFTEKIIEYLAQFREILINRSTTVEDKIISFAEYEKFTLNDIKKYYSSAGAVQKIMKLKKWYLPLYERTNIPFDGIKIVVNTKNMDIFTYSSSTLYTSGGGSGGQNYLYPNRSVANIKLLEKMGMLNQYVILINAVLNSKLIQVNIKNGQFNQLSISKLDDMPIPQVEMVLQGQQNTFRKILEKCQLLINSHSNEKINEFKENQSNKIEKEIDVLIYQLYELTYDEVKIIDKDFWLSEEGYEKIKM